MDLERDDFAFDDALSLRRAELKKDLIVVCKIIRCLSILMDAYFEENSSRVQYAGSLINGNGDFILNIIA